MLAARCHDLSTDCTLGRKGLKGAVYPRFSETNFQTVCCAKMGGTSGKGRHFRPLSAFGPTAIKGIGICEPLDVPDRHPTFYLIDQLLSCDMSQGFAASGDWYQNNSLTIKTDEGQTGHN